MDESPVKIVELRDLTQLEKCAEIQQKIWGISTQDVIPTHLMRAYTDPEEPWGILLGAYADNEMAGFALTLPTSRMDTCLLHMAGVVPEAQNRNIGHKLLQETKIIAAKRGAKKIVLTYDPLESINANLYIRKHSGICRKYVADYYRMHHSKTHSGFPADRFKVEIFLDQKDREKVIPNGPAREIKEIAIPLNFQELKAMNMAKAVAWREQTRPAFMKYLNGEGYIVTGFAMTEAEGRGKYILQKPIV